MFKTRALSTHRMSQPGLSHKKMANSSRQPKRCQMLAKMARSTMSTGFPGTGQQSLGTRGTTLLRNGLREEYKVNRFGWCQVKCAFYTDALQVNEDSARAQRQSTSATRAMVNPTMIMQVTWLSLIGNLQEVRRE